MIVDVVFLLSSHSPFVDRAAKNAEELHSAGISCRTVILSDLIKSLSPKISYDIDNAHCAIGYGSDVVTLMWVMKELYQNWVFIDPEFDQPQKEEEWFYGINLCTEEKSLSNAKKYSLKPSVIITNSLSSAIIPFLESLPSRTRLLEKELYSNTKVSLETRQELTT